jgi:molecular chaperone DnaK
VGGGFVEVIATSGDAHLGGDDFDAAIVDWLVDQVSTRQRHGGIRVA